MKSSFVVVALLGAAACSCADAARLRASRCFCNRDFNPVCAVLPNDARKTFSNACLASCDGGVVLSQGECGGPKYNCDTREVFSPAKAKWCCENEFKGCAPPPTEECFCNRDFNPVCAAVRITDFIVPPETFSNACELNCRLRKTGGVVSGKVQHGKCVREHDRCTDSFQCPAHSYRKHNRKCYDSFDDCECEQGYFKQHGKCVREHDRCTDSFQCPAHSYRKHNRKCYDSFDDCECEQGYFKQRRRCVHEDFHFGPDDDCRDKGRGDRCDQPDGTKGRCTRNGGRCI